MRQLVCDGLWFAGSVCVVAGAAGFDPVVWRVAFIVGGALAIVAGVVGTLRAGK